jgi:hypothetical protein
VLTLDSFDSVSDFQILKTRNSIKSASSSIALIAFLVRRYLFMALNLLFPVLPVPSGKKQGGHRGLLTSKQRPYVRHPHSGSNA